MPISVTYFGVNGNLKRDQTPKTELFDFLYFPTSFGALPLSRDINKQQWRMMTSMSHDVNDNGVKNGNDGVKMVIP